MQEKIVDYLIPPFLVIIIGHRTKTAMSTKIMQFTFHVFKYQEFQISELGMMTFLIGNLKVSTSPKLRCK